MKYKFKIKLSMETYGYDISNPGGLLEPTEKVWLFLSCQNLANLDTVSKSDPWVNVFFHNGGHNDKWVLLGKTETIENSLNPVFVTSFEIDFYFERSQKIKFEVGDADVTTTELIGTVEVSMGKIMGSPGQSLSIDLENKKVKRPGKITIKLERTSHSNDAIYFTGRAYDLPTKKMLFWIGSDNPFYFIERSRSPDSNDFVRVIQSKVASGTNNPIWRNIMYTARKLCNGEQDNRIKFKLYSWDNSGDHKPYGEFTTSLRRLKSGEIEYNICKNDSSVEIPKARFVFEKLVIEERILFYIWFIIIKWKIFRILKDHHSMISFIQDGKLI